MGATSPNGWPLLLKAQTTTFTAGGRRWRTAGGLVAGVFSAFLTRYAAEVEPITDEPATKGQLDDWGWADRPQRDSTTVPSNHWSGTAIDVNSLQHVRGVRETFTDRELNALRALLVDFPVLRWGGDYRSVVDDMHFEINVSQRVLAAWCARHLTAAAQVQQPVHQQPSPQEDDDVVTRADMETIADLVVQRWSQRTLEAPHPVQAGQREQVSFENLLRRAASVIPDGIARGVLLTPPDWAEELFDRETVRVPHPVSEEEADITLRMALGRAASVIPDGVERGVLHDAVDLEELPAPTTAVVGWSSEAEASLAAGARAHQVHVEQALAGIGDQLHELYLLLAEPQPVLVSGSSEQATAVELVRQTHARTVQVASLVAGVKEALDVLATAAAKGNLADAKVLQDTMLSAIRSGLPQVLLPHPADDARTS